MGYTVFLKCKLGMLLFSITVVALILVHVSFLIWSEKRRHYFINTDSVNNFTNQEYHEPYSLYLWNESRLHPRMAFSTGEKARSSLFLFRDAGMITQCWQHCKTISNVAQEQLWLNALSTPPITFMGFELRNGELCSNQPLGHGCSKNTKQKIRNNRFSFESYFSKSDIQFIAWPSYC